MIRSRSFPTLTLLLAVGVWLLGAESGFAQQANPGTIYVIEQGEVAKDPLKVKSCLEEKPAPPPMPDLGGPWCTRPYLTGDWGGTRTCLLEHGIAFNVNATQFYQGVTHGGREEGFQYGGRLDYLLNIDGQKAGLWQGSFISLHGETRYGQDINRQSGLISAPNAAMLFPKPNQDITALTGVKFTQALSENFLVFGGKLNTIDEYLLNFAAGRGVDRYQNLSLVFPTILARTVPYSTVGAGFAVLKDKEPVMSFMVLDAVDHSTTIGVDDAFEKGAVFMGQVSIPVKLFGLPGHQIVGGVWSSRTYSSLDRDSFTFNPGQGLAGITPGSKDGSWCAFYNFDQYLWVDPCNPKRGFGLFGQTGVSDGNPNPIKWFVSGGIGGNSPIASRENDTFGLGFYQLGLSSDFKNLLAPILPQRNERGVELFYNAAITPWFHITADVQVADPSTRRLDSAVMFGLRAKLDF